MVINKSVTFTKTLSDLPTGDPLGRVTISQGCISPFPIWITNSEDALTMVTGNCHWNWKLKNKLYVHVKHGCYISDTKTKNLQLYPEVVSRKKKRDGYFRLDIHIMIVSFTKQVHVAPHCHFNSKNTFYCWVWPGQLGSFQWQTKAIRTEWSCIWIRATQSGIKPFFSCKRQNNKGNPKNYNLKNNNQIINTWKWQKCDSRHTQFLCTALALLYIYICSTWLNNTVHNKLLLAATVLRFIQNIPPNRQKV